MIQTISLRPGVELQCCRDDRFKQGSLSIQFVRPMAADEAAMNALIPNVLLRGTQKHPDLRSITMALDDLYGASVSPLVRRLGDYHATGLCCGFMEPRFALPGDRVLEPMIDFLGELLLEPPTEGGGFLEEFVTQEKENLIDAMEADFNDKQLYAMNRLLQRMCREDSFGLFRLGGKEQVAAATPVSLYQHYQTLRNQSQVRIFYVGSDQPETIARLLEPLFAGHSPLTLPPQTPLHICPGEELTESAEITQGKLCLGFVTPITNRTPEFAAMQIANCIFGGGMTSKLFLKVREKQSLCYSIGSSYYGTKGILTVSAGIDPRMHQTARDSILRQLELCQQGQITQQELTAARESLISGLRSIHDSPGAMESYYSAAALTGMHLTPQAYMDALCAVTAEQAAAAARTITLHTSYFLKGEGANG